MKIITPRLTLVGTFSVYGRGEAVIIIHRDAKGNLYVSNDFVSQQQLTRENNLTAEAAQEIYHTLRQKYSMRCMLVAAYLDQIGCYEHLTRPQRLWADRWNRKYKRI